MMKSLLISIDGRCVFEGDVAEVQWSENDEQVSVVGRITKAPNLAQVLQDAIAQRQLMQNASPEQPDPPDNVLRLPPPGHPAWPADDDGCGDE